MINTAPQQNTSYFIGCDMHRKYSVFACVRENGEPVFVERVNNDYDEMRTFLLSIPPASVIGIEASGGWYWLVDLIEDLGHIPVLLDPLHTRRLLVRVVKTDRHDALGIAKLLASNMHYCVNFLSKHERNLRELTRSRIFLVRKCSSLKNRVHSILRNYNIKISASDAFSKKGFEEINSSLHLLPTHARTSLLSLLHLIQHFQSQIKSLTNSIKNQLNQSPQLQLLQSIPGIGDVLAATILFEIGHISRFPSARHFVSYSGLVPLVSSSGGKVKFSKSRFKPSNLYLRWAFIEAANAIVRWKELYSSWKPMIKYSRLRKSKGHGTAAIALAHHLARSCFFVLSKNQPYDINRFSSHNHNPRGASPRS